VQLGKRLQNRTHQPHELGERQGAGQSTLLCQRLSADEIVSHHEPAVHAPHPNSEGEPRMLERSAEPRRGREALQRPLVQRHAPPQHFQSHVAVVVAREVADAGRTFTQLLQDHVRPESIARFELFRRRKAPRTKLAEQSRVFSALCHYGVSERVHRFFARAALEQRAGERCLRRRSSDCVRVESEQVSAERHELVELVESFQLRSQILHASCKAYPPTALRTPGTRHAAKSRDCGRMARPRRGGEGGSGVSSSADVQPAVGSCSTRCAGGCTTRIARVRAKSGPHSRASDLPGIDIGTRLA
jgi:hypothetical protein